MVWLGFFLVKCWTFLRDINEQWHRKKRLSRIEKDIQVIYIEGHVCYETFGEKKRRKLSGSTIIFLICKTETSTQYQKRVFWIYESLIWKKLVSTVCQWHSILSLSPSLPQSWTSHWEMSLTVLEIFRCADISRSLRA